MRCNAEDLDQVAANSLQQEAPIRYCPAFVTLSSRGLGHRPFTAVTRVRIPLGSHFGFIGECGLAGRFYLHFNKTSQPVVIINLELLPHDEAHRGLAVGSSRQ